MRAASLAACGLGDSGFEELRRRRREVGDREHHDDDHDHHDDHDDDGRPPSTLPGATTSTTTTTTPIQTQPIEFYWIVESTGRDARLKQVIPLSEPSPELLILRLEQGPPLGEASVGLDTKVVDGLVLGVAVARGIATVDRERRGPGRHATDRSSAGDRPARADPDPVPGDRSGPVHARRRRSDRRAAAAQRRAQPGRRTGGLSRTSRSCSSPARARPRPPRRRSRHPTPNRPATDGPIDTGP